MQQLAEIVFDNQSMSMEPLTEPSNFLPLITPELPESVENSVSTASLLQLFEASLADRRASPRQDIAIEWEERQGQSRYFHLTSNLSTFGLATRQGVPHAKGTRLNVLLHLLDGEPPLSLEAEVIGPFDAAGGMRLAFRSPPVKGVRRIHAFLKKMGR